MTATKARMETRAASHTDALISFVIPCFNEAEAFPHLRAASS